MAAASGVAVGRGAAHVNADKLRFCTPTGVVVHAGLTRKVGARSTAVAVVAVVVEAPEVPVDCTYTNNLTLGTAYGVNDTTAETVPSVGCE